MKKILLIALVGLLFGQCAVNRQIQEAKTLGDCQYAIVSADSIYLAGLDVRQFKNVEDINPLKYPKLAMGLLAKNVPLDARLNIDITNPTTKNAAINELEYRVLLAGQELFAGIVNQRIAVAPGGGKTRVPIKINTNAYTLITDAKTRDAFTQFVSNLAGSSNSKPSRVTIKIKPTLSLGNKAVNYPGYITIEQEVTSKMLMGN
jgi:hypothetical protein